MSSLFRARLANRKAHLTASWEQRTPQNSTSSCGAQFHRKLGRFYRRAGRRVNGLGQTIVGVKVINRAGCDQFVLDKYCWGDRATVQNVETHTDQIPAISLREKSDRAKETRLRLAQFCASFRRSIVPHDGAALAASRLLKGP